MKTFADFGIDLGGRAGVEVQTTCPQCSPQRKKPKVPCLSVNTEKGVWCCHHCGWVGSLKTGTDQPSRRERVVIRPPDARVDSADQELVAWFAARGISQAVLEREGIGLVTVYMPQVEREVPSIVFPYRKHGELVNVKYRALHEKHFRQVAGAEKVLYRLDQVVPDQVIITEGEVDALSCVVAGFDSAVSVPEGAPEPNARHMESKFSFLDDEPLAHVQRIILAVDNDAPGRLLIEELARRLGRDRCWRVTWPADCKDANDVLRAYGPKQLQACIEQALPWPIENVVSVSEASESVMDLYHHGLSKGVSTGWDSVNEFYTLEPGQLTIITGIPSHGKSEWLDALSVNLALLHGWRFGVCSPENFPLETHIAKLAEKWTGYPFRQGPSERMATHDLINALQWLHEHFRFILPGHKMTIPIVLDRATSLVKRFGIRGLIIDPFNEFDHVRPRGMTETEYICDVLGELKRGAREWSVHVWLVAHPQKLYRREDGTYPVPTPYDISGSAHWRNRADNCLCVWRDMEDESGETFVFVQKVRFKYIGKPGKVVLRWNVLSGRYAEVGQTCAPHWQDHDHEAGS